MKSYLHLVAIAVLPLSAISCSSTRTASFNKKPEIYHGVRTTAYSHMESDSLQYGHKNAVGTPLKYGSVVRSAAADWSEYPVGTMFKIVGEPHLYEVDDYGSALVDTKTIDIYKPNLSSMRAWGVRNLDIEIVRWGSYQKSLEILEPRTAKASHVRRMAEKIRSDKLKTGSQS